MEIVNILVFLFKKMNDQSGRTVPIVLEFSKSENLSNSSEFIDWTKAEFSFAKKLANSSWLKTQGNKNGREIEIVWGQVNLFRGDKRVDFLLFLEDIIIVIEVKSHEIVTNLLEDRDPWFQCINYRNDIRGLVGNFMPIGGIVVFPKINSPEFKNDSLNIRAKVGEQNFIFTIYKDDLESSNLKNLISQAMKLHFLESGIGVLNKQLHCALASLIPESHVKPIKCIPNMSLYALERTQTHITHNVGYLGNRIIYGVAGSGKTIIIQRKAEFLQQLNLDWNILIVCFNKPLATYLQKNNIQPKIEITTIFAWFRRIMQRWDASKHSELQNSNNSSEYFRKLPFTILEYLEKEESLFRLPTYDAILIDEGQDFQKEWLELLRYAFVPKNPGSEGLFLVCLDSLQAVHKKKESFTWKEIGIKAVGRTKYLRTNYRNASEIAKFAYELIVPLSENLDNKAASTFDPIFSSKYSRMGGLVKQYNLKKTHVIRYLADIISNLQKGFNALIVVEGSYIKRFLINGINAINKSLIKRNSISKVIDCTQNEVYLPGIELIPIYTVRRSKGLEADVVLYIFEDQNNLQLAYVGVTRAREVLHCIKID